LAAEKPSAEMGSVTQLINQFGGKDEFESAVHEMQSTLYSEAS
jgi:type I restriction enzyme R subunit